MTQSAKHRGASQPSRRDAVSRGTRHRQPGRRKAAKSTPSFGAVPALAGVASLIAAASGAVALQPGTLTAHADGALPETEQATQAAAAQALTAGAVQQAREAAVDRANRSSREEAAAEAEERDEETLAAEEAEFEEWEKQRTAEIDKVEEKAERSVKTSFVLERAIGWQSPLGSYRLSARFGQAGGYWSSGYHTGQDFSAPSGTAIAAVGDGEVIAATYEGAYGNQVKIRHEDGTETWYAHMSGFAVSTGQWVSAGQTIGYVGSTGNSTGPHLHLEVHLPGSGAVEPLGWLRERGVQL